jgi:hydrogenase nickel incorporation protein HypA/HybF
VSHEQNPPEARTVVHELSITQSVVDAVSEHAAGSRVLAVRVTVGRLCGVAPDAMRLCFELITEGTQLQGARLDIDVLAGRELNITSVEVV